MKGDTNFYDCTQECIKAGITGGTCEVLKDHCGDGPGAVERIEVLGKTADRDPMPVAEGRPPTVGGPVFMAFAGMSLYTVFKIPGKPVHKPAWAMASPWVWLVGVALFSTAGSINGLHGEPRRTNLGLTYLNPDSPLFRPEWRTWAPIMALGGIVMFLACVMWFHCFFGTLARKSVEAPELDFPESKALHQKQVGWVANFRPWVVVAVLLILISYVPPILGLSKGTFNDAPRYSPETPVVQE